MNKMSKKLESEIINYLKSKLGPIKTNLNLREPKDKDKPGFKTESLEGRFRVYTLRQDCYIPCNKHWYSITVFRGPEPKDIVVQIRTRLFEEAIIKHYGVLDYIKNCEI